MDLTQSFFVLSTDYKSTLLQEIYYLSKFLHFTYMDYMSMPVFERKFLLNMLVEEKEKENNEWEKSKNKND